MGFELEAAPRTIGRFDIEKKGEKRLRLVARERTQTYLMKWGRWPTAAVLVGLCAWGRTLNPVAPSFFLGFGGIVYAVTVMIDFARVATAGVFSTVERSLEIDASASPRVVVDGVVMSSPVRDVRVLCESTSRSDGGEVCRVYLVFDDHVVTVESTTSRVAALRLGSLLRAALGLPSVEQPGGESLTAGGCVWSGLFFVLATLAPMGVAPVAIYLTSVPEVFGLAVAFALGLVVLEHVFALPMRRAVREHVRKNLET